MNIYDLLRFFVTSLSSLGPVSKENAFNAIDLVNQLEKMSAFGEIGRITTGAHQFKTRIVNGNTNYREVLPVCAICGKAETEHE